MNPPMSAARLAAEAAFAEAPRPPAPPAVAAQVILRRSRLAGATGEPAANERPSEAPASAEKGARVFRVHTPAAAAPLAPPAHVVADAALPPVVPRARKARADQRPGPVVVVLQAAPAPVAPPPEPPPARLEDLLAELHRAGDVLAVAERAQAFRVEPEGGTREWHQLAQKIERLKKSLQKPAR
jgi:hypothetical protein